ncbi:hypothetical protein F5882DRAFT_458485 [Hyaloscypha sp. PMI_1271]|nr:hypothetical protein F5882DRAFT_458485 [Hyaloscypha sp. PMI_1271]
MSPDPALLIALLSALISNPNVFAEHKTTTQDLTHKACLAFGGHHETMQRIMFSVLAPPPLEKFLLQPLPTVLAYVGQEYGISKTPVEVAEPPSFQVLAANNDIGPNVLHAILDSMVCQDMIQEIGLHLYKAMRQTRSLVNPACVDAMILGPSPLPFPLSQSGLEANW